MERIATLALVCCVSFGSIRSTASLELDWIPAGDGPLPLSAAYRERLSRLCDVVENARGPLPPSIQARLRDIEKMCAKLRRAERSGPVGNLRALVVYAVGAGVGAWAVHSYQNRGWVYKVIQDQQRQLRARSSYKARGSGSPLFPKVYSSLTDR
mmetsp:Transcript_1947/g.4940  ORF Transcript_1947/g.4940 Transcript_1947/m.4940 type:complete len:154 (-) Transcript_1947:1046-1507(-)